MGNIKRNMGRIALLLALCLATVSVLTVAQAKHPSVAHADWSSDMDDCSQLTPSIAYNYDGNQLYNWGGPLGDWSWDGGQHYIAACDNSSPAWGNDGTDPTTHVAYADTTHNINNVAVTGYGAAFQCVELVARYADARWGYDPSSWPDAGDAFGNHPDPTHLLAITPSQVNYPPVPGDIMDWAGHIDIVMSVSGNLQSGTILTLDQNVVWTTDNQPFGSVLTYSYTIGSGGLKLFNYAGHQMTDFNGWLHHVGVTGYGSTWRNTTGYSNGGNGSVVSPPPTNLRGDFNGDGKSDMAAAYNYGNATTGIWIWTGSSGLGSHIEAWKSAAGAWDATKTKWAVGDFNGDGKADLAAVYDDGNDAISIWIWLGTSSGSYLSAPVEAWSCSSNCWSWNNSAPIVGDFNGDGMTDLAIAYNYGSANTAIWVWPGISSSPYLGQRSKVWTSPTGGWDWTKTKWAAGDYNGDGKTDIAGVYDNGNDSTSIWVWPGTSSGFLSSPIQAWTCGSNCWSWGNSTPIAGDYNGDGMTDLAIIYDYGSGTTGIWVWPGTSSGSYLGNRSQVWHCGPNCWTDSNTKWASGDYNGDGFDDLMGMYDYGNGTTGVWIWSGGTGSNELSNRSESWTCGPNCWTWSNNTVAEAQ